ncbi:hypothetical protein IMCC3135_04860 [Granulosicoccus antarcticus IMCC3135]|uniref:Uncharacterized protein n=1 Tax=Granulosicoccus antarcticus IMCC3135 TaxID=1192854 RepID=A0A2Z2NKN9_9GAMM|nr:hypothetical protein IMCC3135_04860 [Granulosicoccus antarcticus IMCC3135]
MNAPTKLKLLMDRVFAPGCLVAKSHFKKVSQRVDQNSGDQIVMIEFRFKVDGASPSVQKTKIPESSASYPMLASLTASGETD